MSQNGQQQEAETKVARWIQSSLISIKTSYFVLHISWGEGCCWRCSGDPALYYTTFTPPSIGFLKAGKLATKRRLTFTFLISRRRVCLLFCSGCFSLHYIQRTLKLVLKSFNHSESDTFSNSGADDETSQEQDISHLLHLCWKLQMHNTSGYFF